MKIEIDTSFTAQEFRDNATTLPVGAYHLDAEYADREQFAYLNGLGEITYAKSEEDLVKLARRRMGDFYTDAQALANEQSKNGFVTIRHVVGIAKTIQHKHGTRLDSENRTHFIDVQTSTLELWVDLEKDRKYLIFKEPNLPKIATIVREQDGELVTGLPGAINWVYL